MKTSKPRLLCRFLLIYSILSGVSAFMAENSAATFLSAAEQQWLKEKKEIVFISQTLYPPFEFIAADNNRKGMCIELVSWIATELGFKAVFQDASFAEAQAAVLDGRADVITSLFHSLGRKRDFAFTEVTWEVAGPDLHPCAKT
ncbi:MAG TPA: transporter substrate-binding domain-containing protein [Proteobacteria bacterium]|nr:transporter substrate-binding domain-containing protein [Pseudomonadota bacterium]